MSNKTSDWSEALPRNLKMRLDGIGSYVTAVIEDIGYERYLTPASVQKIQFLAFLKSLDEFLRDGTQAAISAVDAFASVDISRFKIGSQEFEGRNGPVMRGEMLSNALRQALMDEGLSQLIAKDCSLREAVVSIARTLKNDRRLD